MKLNKLNLFQSTEGYRYSIDSFILADFVSPSEKQNIIDFGTGNGIIPLLLSRKTKSKIIGLDVQNSLLSHAYRNFVQHGLEDQVALIQGDIRLSKLFLKNGFFDIVVSNPPYRKLNSGRLNPNPEKAIARHEILITLPELVENAANLLRNNGKLVMIYLAERYDELVAAMANNGLSLNKFRFVHSHKKSEPKMFLVEGIKNAKRQRPQPQFGMENRIGRTALQSARRVEAKDSRKSKGLSPVTLAKSSHNEKLLQCNDIKGERVALDPLYIYDSNGNYTLEMQNIYDSFNNHCGTNINRKIGECASPGKATEK